MTQGKKPRLPTDANGRAVEIPFRPTTALVGTPYSSTSVMTSTLPYSHCYVRLLATQPCFYKRISSSGVAGPTDHYLPANVPYDIEMQDHNRIAVVGQSITPDGKLYVTVRGG